LPGSPPLAHYSTCLADSTVGISVGWRDVYLASLPGQVLDIEGVPDGNYCVAVTSDPDGRLLESDDSNNTSRRGVLLAGGTVSDSAAGCDPTYRPPQATPAPVQPRKAKRACGKLKKRAAKRRCRKKRRIKARRPARGSRFQPAAPQLAGYGFFCPALSRSESAFRSASAAAAG
jgi:hypothetical protein